MACLNVSVPSSMLWASITAEPASNWSEPAYVWTTGRDIAYVPAEYEDAKPAGYTAFIGTSNDCRKVNEALRASASSTVIVSDGIPFSDMASSASHKTEYVDPPSLGDMEVLVPADSSSRKALTV